MVSRKFAREGSFSMLAHIDCMKSPNPFRTEAVIPGLAKKLKFERDYWYGFSTYIPDDWELTGNIELLAQFHSTLDSDDPKVGPPMSLRVGKNGEWEIVSRAEGFNRRSGVEVWTLNAAIDDSGRWTDWVIQFRPSFKSSGVLRIWKDAELVADRYGANTYKDETGPYFKMGIYAPRWKHIECTESTVHTKNVYHDSLRIASGTDAGYYDVAPSLADRDESKGTPGSVRIANYVTRQAVEGVIQIEVLAYDPDGIKKVVLRADDAEEFHIIGERTASPWRFTLDTSRYAGAERLRLKAVMHDSLGEKDHHIVRLRLADD